MYMVNVLVSRGENKTKLNMKSLQPNDGNISITFNTRSRRTEYNGQYSN